MCELAKQSKLGKICRFRLFYAPQRTVALLRVCVRYTHCPSLPAPCPICLSTACVCFDTLQPNSLIEQH